MDTQLKTADFLESDEFCRQFKKEWENYNKDIHNAIELIKIIDDDEKCD